jgi:hypothetical protein
MTRVPQLPNLESKYSRFGIKDPKNRAGSKEPIIKGVLKKSPRSSREFRNSHDNLKKRKIYTVGFYEDLTV